MDTSANIALFNLFAIITIVFLAATIVLFMVYIFAKARDNHQDVKIFKLATSLCCIIAVLSCVVLIMTEPHCNRCNQRLKVSDVFCRACGASIDEEKPECYVCSTQLEPNDKFCYNCGEAAERNQDE